MTPTALLPDLRDGAVVWITGASSGIGEHLAYSLAALGAHVVLSARRVPELERVAAGCGEHATVLPLDLTDPPEAMSAAVSAVQSAHGRIDYLINNAGIGQSGRVEETLDAVYLRTMQINFFGTAALIRAALPVMLEQGAGHITAVSSVLGYIPIPERSAYSASKRALQALCDGLRCEVAHRGVDILVACLGGVSTDISLSALDGQGRPIGEKTAEDLAAMAPDRCAAQIVRAIRRRRAEVLIGTPYEKLGVYLYRHLPALYRLIGPQLR